jgi:putative membrane protein
MLRRIRSIRWTAAVVSILFALAAGSCAKKEETSETPPDTTQPPAPTLTDANIAAIVLAANKIEIDNGTLAQSKSKSAQVKAFAKQMITDHTSVNQKATDLATKLNLTPEDNETSRQLVSSANATRDSLKAKTGADFDKAYIDNEVTVHESVIDMLDKTLIPATQNAELKSLLESARPTFVAHLDHAKQVQAALSK